MLVLVFITEINFDVKSFFFLLTLHFQDHLLFIIKKIRKYNKCMSKL